MKNPLTKFLSNKTNLWVLHALCYFLVTFIVSSALSIGSTIVVVLLIIGTNLISRMMGVSEGIIQGVMSRNYIRKQALKAFTDGAKKASRANRHSKKKK